MEIPWRFIILPIKTTSYTIDSYDKPLTAMTNLQIHYRLAFLGFLLYLLFAGTHALADDTPYDIVISRSEKALNIMRGDTVIKQYPITYGKGGKGAKRVQGDKKTPLGVYKIINFKDNSKFHFFMQLDYPNLLDAWYGYKNEIITANEFKYITRTIKNKGTPPQDTRLGGYIGIHGLGTTTEQKLAIHQEINWTDGCIAMTNEEINDLRQYVDIGTKVIINR